MLSVTKSHKLKQTALFSTLLWCRWDFRESTPAGHYRERRFKALSKLNFNFSQILYLKTRTFTELLTSSSWSFKSMSLKAVDFHPHLLQKSHISYSFVLFLSKLSSISPRLPLKNQIRSREEHWRATAVFQSFKSFCESLRGRSHWVLRVLCSIFSPITKRLGVSSYFSYCCYGDDTKFSPWILGSSHRWGQFIA